MDSENFRTGEIDTGMDREICDLYHQLILAWNQREASIFSSLFTLDGTVIGFDGSLLTGTFEIDSNLAQIFKNHQTPPYFTIIQSTRFLTDECAILGAIAGMDPKKTGKVDSAYNARQTLVAVQRDGIWKVCHFQNTPAALHGRPEEVSKMTSDLQESMNSKK